MQNQVMNNETQTWQSMPYPMGDALRNEYGSDFKRVVMASWDFVETITYGEQRLSKTGKYMEPEGPGLLDLDMIAGDKKALAAPDAILLSASTAESLFGKEDPIGKAIKINNAQTASVQGIYKDLPTSSEFGKLNYIASWRIYINRMPWVEQHQNPWGNNSFLVYVQVADNSNIESVSKKIADVRYNHIAEDERRFRPTLFIHPMEKWHVRDAFKNGKNVGGFINTIWLFGIIGVFVLLLACINFMNLSTARSERRAREVGIRKATGSLRSQLMTQFFTESLLTVFLSLILALLLVQLALPLFNTVADKVISFPWKSAPFWTIVLSVSFFTAIVAGSYPAFYLSSFQPVKVLKGTFKAGRYAAIPRKALVIVQFTVSIILIIGTLVVFRQIQYARDRPVGYSRDGLLTLNVRNDKTHQHFKAIKDELKGNGAIVDMSEADAPPTSVWSTYGGISWPGKDPSLAVDFPTTGVSEEYAAVLGWQFKQGRNFSKQLASDSFALVVNEAAVSFMGLKNPVGTVVDVDGTRLTIIGVISNMIVESPYAPVRPSMWYLNRQHGSIVNIKVNPAISMQEALARIEPVFSKYDPEQLFEYKFADAEYAKKFGQEQRIGKLASFFAILAIFISCLGLFGMASFMAERRTKEIGVRKVLGASVISLWQLLSKEFVALVVISLLIAAPLAYFMMRNWLQNYEYRTTISWWIYAVTGLGILTITLLTVSYQSIKAAMLNPVKSLKTE